MSRNVWRISVFAGMFWVSCMFAGSIHAEELKFPSETEDILEWLDQDLDPSQKIDVKSLATEESGTKKRGIKQVAQDDAIIKKASKVGALILFDTNSAKIKPESLALLDKYGEALSARPGMDIVIAGHTDNRGNEKYNLMLSERRAKAVKEYLVSHYQLAGGRLYVLGFGEHSPYKTNETAEGRSQNRRVEFIKVD